MKKIEETLGRIEKFTKKLHIRMSRKESGKRYKCRKDQRKKWKIPQYRKNEGKIM